MKKTIKNNLGLTEYLYTIEILKSSDSFDKGEKFKIYGLTTDNAFDKFGTEYVGNNNYWIKLSVNYYDPDIKENQKILRITK